MNSAGVECPICQTSLPASTTECPVCGARLPTASPEIDAPDGYHARSRGPVYDPALGEDDLYAPHLARVPWWGMVFPLLLIGVLAAALLVWGGTSLFRRIGEGASAGPAPVGGRTAVPTLALGGASPPPTLFLPTLTLPPPPTNTLPPTSTPGPCEQTVQEGDTLIMLAMRCGHQSLDVIDAIVELNGLRSEEQALQIGQVILIPWPTPTPGGALSTAEGETAGEESSLPGLPAPESGGEGEAGSMLVSAVIPTATLQPGVMWYTVQRGDTILAIAIEFNANIEILSQLNPEVTFSQCDFGMDSGGGSCIVNLFEGQQLRVPAPTPTPTLSPTPSGSETPTPTPTPTFNAPSLLSPGDRALFGGSEMVTLRWVSTGVLTEGDVYLVTVTDTSGGVIYTAATTETFFIVPSAWQPADGQRHLFTWNVAVGPSDGAGGLASVTFTTGSRMFFWDSP